MITINLDRRSRTLTLRHTTPENFAGILVVPTDVYAQEAYEAVIAPDGKTIHEETFFASSLEYDGTARNLQSYLVALVNSQRRKVA